MPPYASRLGSQPKLYHGINECRPLRSAIARINRKRYAYGQAIRGAPTMPRLSWLASLLLSCLATIAARAGEPPVIRVGMGDSQPPYLIAGTRDGIEYDIIEGTLSLAGYRLEPRFYPLSRMQALYRSGELDAAATVTENTGLPGCYSAPYIAYRHAAITLAARKLEINSITDLGHYSIATFQTARTELGEDFRAMADANPHYQEVSPQVLRNNMLYTGHVDVVVGDPTIFRYLNREVPSWIDTHQAITVHPIFPPHPYKIVFADKQVCERFNAALKQFVTSPEYEQIQKKYEWTPELPSSER